MKEEKMKKETETEFLARLMAEGFGQVNTRFDVVDARFDKMDARFDGIDARIDGIDGRLLSLEKIQSQTLYRLDSIERKQDGMLQSIDETVHRSEFVKLTQRVVVLEKK